MARGAGHRHSQHPLAALRRKRILRLTVSDERRLTELRTLALPLWKWVLLGAGAVATVLVLGALAMTLTPLRTRIPGFLKQDQRTAAEMAVMRTDSLREAVAANRLYLDNLRKVLDPTREPSKPDSVIAPGAGRSETDTLLLPSAAEERFAERMGRQSGYNTTVLAPLAAEGMVFRFPATSGIYDSSTLGSTRVRLLLPAGAAVCAVAEGRVVGLARDFTSRGWTVWVQHDNGFLSRSSRLGTPVVEAGQRVEGGEALAPAASGTGTRGGEAWLEMWHDGEPLLPARYLPTSE